MQAGEKHLESSGAPAHNSAVVIPLHDEPLVEALITIDLPLEEVFAFMRELNNVPRFMKRVESVQPSPGSTVRSTWHYRTAAGLPSEWQTDIIAEIENRLISWVAAPGEALIEAGSFWFRAYGARTEVSIQLRYRTPHPRFAQGLGITLTELLGEDPERALNDDLATLKELLEARH